MRVRTKVLIASLGCVAIAGAAVLCWTLSVGSASGTQSGQALSPSARVRMEKWRAVAGIRPSPIVGAQGIEARARRININADVERLHAIQSFVPGPDFSQIYAIERSINPRFESFIVFADDEDREEAFLVSINLKYGDVTAEQISFSVPDALFRSWKSEESNGQVEIGYRKFFEAPSGVVASRDNETLLVRCSNGTTKSFTSSFADVGWQRGSYDYLFGGYWNRWNVLFVEKRYYEGGEVRFFDGTTCSEFNPWHDGQSRSVCLVPNFSHDGKFAIFDSPDPSYCINEGSIVARVVGKRFSMISKFRTEEVGEPRWVGEHVFAFNDKIGRACARVIEKKEIVIEGTECPAEVGHASREISGPDDPVLHR